MEFDFSSRLTSFFGFRLLEAKAGEVCVVNGAAGAVGSIVGQLAKLQVIISIAWLTTTMIHFHPRV